MSNFFTHYSVLSNTKYSEKLIPPKYQTKEEKVKHLEFFQVLEYSVKSLPNPDSYHLSDPVANWLELKVPNVCLISNQTQTSPLLGVEAHLLRP